MHVRVGYCGAACLRAPAARSRAARQNVCDQGHRKRFFHRQGPRPARSFLPRPPGTARARHPRSSPTRHAPRRRTRRTLENQREWNHGFTRINTDKSEKRKNPGASAFAAYLFALVFSSLLFLNPCSSVCIRGSISLVGDSARNNCRHRTAAKFTSVERRIARLAGGPFRAERPFV